MLGAIAGGIIGSPYESRNHRSTRFPLFRPISHTTDDTVLRRLDKPLRNTVDTLRATYIRGKER